MDDNNLDLLDIWDYWKGARPPSPPPVGDDDEPLPGDRGRWIVILDGDLTPNGEATAIHLSWVYGSLRLRNYVDGVTIDEGELGLTPQEVWQRAKQRINCIGDLFVPYEDDTFWRQRCREITVAFRAAARRYEQELRKRADADPYRNRLTLESAVYSHAHFRDATKEFYAAALYYLDRTVGGSASWRLTHDDRGTAVLLLALSSPAGTASEQFKSDDLHVATVMMRLTAHVAVAAVPVAVAWHAGNLAHDDERVRLAAAEALARLGPDASDAVDALLQAMGRTTPLEPIYPPGAETWDSWKRFQWNMNHTDYKRTQLAVCRAAWALGCIGANAAGAIPALRRIALQQDDSSLRRAAEDAIGRIDPLIKSAVIGQREAERRERDRVDGEARAALEERERLAREQMPHHLVAALRQEKTRRDRAQWNLIELGRAEPERIKPILIGYLDSMVDVRDSDGYCIIPRTLLQIDPNWDRDIPD